MIHRAAAKMSTTAFHGIIKVSLAWLLAMPACGQRQKVASVPEQALIKWLAAFDGSDWHRYQAFIKDHFHIPPEPMLRDKRFREQTGGFRLKKVQNVTAASVAAFLQERESDQVVVAQLQISGEVPARIIKLQLHPVPRPPELPLAHLQPQDLVDVAAKRLSQLASQQKFSGVVLIAEGNAPIFVHAYGLADRQSSIPNSIETRFRIGSMKKMFTAVCILQLASWKALFRCPARTLSF